MGRSAMEKQISLATDQLISAIQQSETYRNYVICEAKIKEMPGMAEKIAELRNATIEAYNDAATDDLVESSDRISSQYEELQKIPEVIAFLDAENDLVRVLQKISVKIISSVDMLIPQS